MKFRPTASRGCSPAAAKFLSSTASLVSSAESDDVARTDSQGKQIFAGHLGTIYQSSNAVYAARATPRTLKLLPDGRVFSERAIQKIRQGESGWRYASEQLVRFGASSPVPDDMDARRLWLAEWLKRLTRPLRHPGNHRYLWALGRGVRLPLSLPYPKIKLADRQSNLF